MNNLGARLIAGTLLLLTVFGQATAAGVASQADDPELIYHNGKILTGTEAGFAQAVAVRDGRIVALGSDIDVLQRRTEATSIVDLEGHTMLPGFFDNHIHLGRSGPPLMEWRGGLIAAVPEWINGATNVTELQDALRAEATATQACAGEVLKKHTARAVEF